MKIYCEKCGSDKVTDTILNPPEAEKISMEDFANRDAFTVTTLEMKYFQHRLECENCGHRIEYTR